MRKPALYGLMQILAIVTVAQQQDGIRSQVDNLVKPLVATNNFSGTIVVSKDNRTILSSAYGKMSREYGLDNSLETKYYLASVSMVFTSAAILKLYEQGKLNLNDPLSKFIPDYPRGKDITISLMLAQRSGIPPIGASGKVNYDSLTKFGHTIANLINYFKFEPLLFDPGAKYNHGRSEYILLAFIIEKVSGKEYGQYLKDEIFQPLGMNDSGHNYGEKEIVANLARGYAPKDLYDAEVAYQIDWTSKTGHASVYSSAGDLQKFGQAILTGTLLKKETWDLALTNQGGDVGYGWFFRKHLNRDLFQMNGRAPGYSSYLGFYPKEKLVVVVLSNNYVPLPADLGKSIAAIALNEQYESLNLTDKQVDAQYGRKLVGVYKFDDQFYRPNFELEITWKDGRLHSTWGGLIPIDKGKSNFDEFILRPFWSSIRFYESSAGVSHMTFDHFKGVKIR